MINFSTMLFMQTINNILFFNLNYLVVICTKWQIFRRMRGTYIMLTHFNQAMTWHHAIDCGSQLTASQLLLWLNFPHHHLLIFNNILWRAPLCSTTTERKSRSIRTNEQTMNITYNRLADNNQFSYALLTNGTCVCVVEINNTRGKKNKSQFTSGCFECLLYTCNRRPFDPEQLRIENKSKWVCCPNQRQKKWNVVENEFQHKDSSMHWFYMNGTRWLRRIIYSEFNRIPLSQWFLSSVVH